MKGAVKNAIIAVLLLFFVYGFFFPRLPVDELIAMRYAIFLWSLLAILFTYLNSMSRRGNIFGGLGSFK